jgi:lysophospholipase L1-like esterase
MEIHFLRQPGGGVLKVEAAGQALGSVETDGPTKEPAYQTFPLNAGMRDINLSVERGPVRMFGVSFEKNTPGVIYNSLGLNGGQVQFIVRYFDKPQWTEELEHQHPDLVVINYGTNESIYADYIERYYPGELRQVIERVKAAVPRASVLIMSPMGRGQRDSNARITTVPTLPKLVDIQRQMAQETGCAFFNTFQAMGGEGTMARWYDSTPRLVSADFTHPLPAGARKVGVLLDQALESGYRKFKAREQQRSAHQ